MFLFFLKEEHRFFILLPNHSLLNDFFLNIFVEVFVLGTLSLKKRFTLYIRAVFVSLQDFGKSHGKLS